MTYFHAIVKGSRLTTACQHWQGMCQIIYYTYYTCSFPFFFIFFIFPLLLTGREKCSFHYYCSFLPTDVSPVYVACR